MARILNVLGWIGTAVVFGSVAFADWLTWVGGLQSQQIRLESSRIEALSTPGLVGITASFARAGSPRSQ
mgnify:CR=1 FL=1